MLRKTFYLTPAIIRWLEKKAEKEKRSVSNFLNTFLEKLMKEEK